jgi:hypothetical protein
MAILRDFAAWVKLNIDSNSMEKGPLGKAISCSADLEISAIPKNISNIMHK